MPSLFRITKTAGHELERLGVVVLYLFGSRAVGAEGPLSDYDFGVLMKTAGHKRGDSTYDAIYDVLSPFCPRTMKNDVIDIVFLNDAPLELRAHVMRYGQILYESKPLMRGRFEEKTILEASDFRPLQLQIDKTILASL